MRHAARLSRSATIATRRRGIAQRSRLAFCGPAIILLEYGALSSEPTPFPLFTVPGKSLTLKGYLYSENVSDDAALDRAKAFIINGLSSGELKPLIARTFTLDEIQEATASWNLTNRSARSWSGSDAISTSRFRTLVSGRKAQ